jgi:hypothetical protein
VPFKAISIRDPKMGKCRERSNLYVTSHLSLDRTFFPAHVVRMVLNHYHFLFNVFPNCRL